MRSHFLAFFLSNVVLRPLNILAANDYQYLQLDVEKIGVENVKTVQKRPISDHSNLHMPEICGKICDIMSTHNV